MTTITDREAIIELNDMFGRLNEGQTDIAKVLGELLERVIKLEKENDR